MAFKRISPMYFMADSVEDLQYLPKAPMGAECFVIAEACEYKSTSDNRWIKQVKTIAANGVDLTDYVTKDQLQDQMQEAIDDFIIPLSTEDVLNLCKT